ncbi:carboxylating nicotinate-nucleotide diphosphorylase [Thermosipho ferrireducens]|uniref:nicotinate-nucleotide diphosphorylase (carboxylating) n=1 Tax=Thermosipho ferrireducens TaxID=2571116 RepID=A0ABX7SA10_9BACT|nr:carboxylating nicotinate-nucleotide diphosphorylase [Thermosipho ferrireducens]QTA38238.1 carboxylating nicotinate-nucleotide diphosphorylase [Thermosipho ferrireducens]
MFEYEIRLVKNWIEKDSSFFDIASYGLKDRKASGEIILKQSNVIISGIEFIKTLLDEYQIEYEFFVHDGELVNKNTIGIISGNAYNILIVERTMLNIFSLMTAIATKTYNLVSRIRGTTKLAATRKVFPGIGNLEKLAVMHGGGDTHRFSLSDCIMIKDNHIKLYGGVKEAIDEVKKYGSFTKKIEVEIEKEEDAFIAAKYGADIVMLDNFSPEKAKSLAWKLKQSFSDLIIEVSGGINENNYLEYVDDNIDVISMGKLTTEISYIDFSLEIK